MAEGISMQGISRTFRPPSDNPLRVDARNTLTNKAEGNLGSIRLLFRKLEKVMSKEIRAYWESCTLSEYITSEHVPRGLRIKKFPTFELIDEDHKKRWTDSLSRCSVELMSIIISSKQKEIETLQMEISKIQDDIKPLQGLADFKDLDKVLNERLNRLENEIIESKKEKMLRDKLDYDTDSVYVWRRERHRTPSAGRHVSFSEPESEYMDESAVSSDSDQTNTTAMKRTPGSSSSSVQKNCSAKKKPHKKKKPEGEKGKQGEGASGGDNTTAGRYPIRNQPRKK